MPLGTEVGLGPEDIVLDGDPSPLPQKAAEPSPQFSAHFCCGQTAGWIKVVFGMELGLLPGHIVLDGEPCSSPSPKRGRAPHFGLGTEVYASAYSTLGQMETQPPRPQKGGLRPGDFVSDEDPASPPQKGGGAPSPIFGPFLLWPNLSLIHISEPTRPY